VRRARGVRAHGEGGPGAGTQVGGTLVGFGRRRLRNDDGRELDWMVIGFSPREATTTLYLSGGVDHYADLLEKLGRHTTGEG